jgi:ribosomal protein S18 acetylase RimI-like enzyme
MQKPTPKDATEVVSEELTVRRLTSLDAESYNHLSLEAFRKNPKNFARSYEEERGRPLEQVASHLDQNVCIGVFEGDVLVGSVTLAKEHLEKMSHKGDIREMYVDDTRRGRGIGKRLLEALFIEAESQGIEELGLTVGKANAPAIRLYESMGFTVWGEERAGLKLRDGTPVDEYHMAKRIGAASEVGEAELDAERGKGRAKVGAVTETLTSRTFRRRYLDAFGGRESYSESYMQDAVLCLHEMISSDPHYAELWDGAWEGAGRFEHYDFSTLGGNTVYVDRMVTNSGRYLNEILTRSTFMHLGTAAQVRLNLEAALRGERSSLGEVARQIRSALETKMFQNAAREIASERNRRLAAAFGLQSPHQIIPAHRFQYPSYDVVIPEQMEAYMNGDRTERVFSIGEWTHSDLNNGHFPVAQRGQQSAET